MIEGIKLEPTGPRPFFSWDGEMQIRMRISGAQLPAYLRLGGRSARLAFSARTLARSLLALGLFAILTLSDVAAAETVGKVTRVENQAQVAGVPAVVGSAVRMNDQLRTGAKARLEITFRDQTKLTLGENARVAVDRYVYNPSRSTGVLTVEAAQGAMRFVTGKIGKMQDRNVTVVTSHSALAVRGTDVWVGPINGQYGVLLLKGNVGVTGRRQKRPSR